MTASIILEPLAEGPALFAEFDAYPGNSRWMSQTLSTSLILFAPAVETDGRPPLLLEGLLQTLRRDPQLLERKAGIYARPLNVLDPYLIGYLSVRSLWCQMAAACSELNDRDVFLSYLRSYIYDDPGMVLCLLESYSSEVHAYGAIVDHLLSRIGGLVSYEGLSSRVEQWIESAERGNVDVASIKAKAEHEQRADEMTAAALVSDVDDVDDEAGTTLAAWMLMTLEERGLCVIGSTLVQLKSMANGFDITAEGVNEPVYSIPADSIPNAREGEVTVVASSDGHGIVVLLRVEKNVVVLSSFGKFNDAELKLAKRHVVNRPISNSLHEEFRAKLENDPVVMKVWEFVAKRDGRHE